MLYPKLPMVVALGGGHGLSASLQALRQVTNDLVAVVTVADDGGSSGRLRKELGGLPPGDLRMALAALCSESARGRSWSKLIQQRYSSEGALNGHAVGNLLIEAAWQILDPVRGLDFIANMIGVEGRVLPMCTQPLEIEAQIYQPSGAQGEQIKTLVGQHQVATTTSEVLTLRLKPENPPACREAVQAIMAADYVVLGPGSWFTSVLPHLLVPELREAIIATKAKKILTLNISPEFETAGFSASRHIEVITEHAPELRLDYVLADDGFGKDEKYIGSFVNNLGGELIFADLRMRDGSPRHEPLRLASAYREIMDLES